MYIYKDTTSDTGNACMIYIPRIQCCCFSKQCESWVVQDWNLRQVYVPKLNIDQLIK